MITVGYSGRLGNNLFQYCVARILSENLNQKVCGYSSEIVGFPLDFYKCDNDKNYDTTIDVNDNNFLNILKLKNIDANLHLSSYYQNKTFILEYGEKIKSIVKANTSTIDGISVTYRLGDIAGSNFCVNHDYYKYCLDKILNKEVKKVYITSGEPDHYLVQNLAALYNAEILRLPPKDTMLFCSQFTNKIISLGTFSWWIGFLNNQENVYFPNRDDYGHWHGDIFVLNNWTQINKSDYIKK
jgi:hypothetical protein